MYTKLCIENIISRAFVVRYNIYRHKSFRGRLGHLVDEICTIKWSIEI